MALELRTSRPSLDLASLPRVDPDPLASEDVLAECDIQKCSVNIAAGTAAVIFDLKGSLYFDDANVAVMLAGDLQSAAWTGRRDLYKQRYQAYYVGASRLTSLGGGTWRMWVGAINGEELSLDAGTVTVWLGNVSWGDSAPPAYDEEPDDAIERRLYQWDTLAVPVCWTSTELF
jgi:hypothetical protein